MDVHRERVGESRQVEAERLTVGEIFALIAGGWRVIVSIVVLLIIAAALTSLFAAREYKTYYVAMPAPTEGDPLRPVGLNLDLLGHESGTPEWQMYVSLLTSVTVADRLVKTTPILQRLYPKRWDAENKRWKTVVSFDSSSFAGKIKWLFGMRSQRAPDKFTLQHYLEQNLDVSHIPQTTQMVISLDATDPDASLLLLTALHRTANDLVSEARGERAVRQRAQLLKELRTTTVVDYRQTLLNILSSVETNIMSAQVGGDYAAIRIDGPVIQPEPVFPRPVLLFELAIIVGCVVGIIAVVFFPVKDSSLMALLDYVRRWRQAGRPDQAESSSVGSDVSTASPSSPRNTLRQR